MSSSRMVVVFNLSAFVVVVLIIITLLGIGADAFVAPSLPLIGGVKKTKINININTCSSWDHRSSTTTVTTTRTFLTANKDDDDEEEEIFTPTTSSSSTRSDNDNDNAGAEAATADDPNNSKDSDFMDDLTPPPVNFARNSILFSDDPATKRHNNSALEAWKFARTYLPAFVTGAWPWRDIPTLDERPLAALYNAAFVRLPVVAVGVAYLNQKIFEGRDLVMDFGFDPLGGPQAINPVLVIAVLVLILL